MNNTSKNPEAIDWLKSNKNLDPLAGNRFKNKAEALEFVEKLYEYGAISVSVSGIFDDEERILREGGPYADTLIVHLPLDQNNRKKLFEIFNKEIKREGYDEILKDEGQKHVDLWWD